MTDEDRKSSPPRAPRRHHLPNERKSITHKFTIGGVDEKGRPKDTEGYMTVGLFPDGSPGEIFCHLAKTGSRESCLLDAWCVMVSLGLQCGMPLDVVIDKFKAWSFQPAGLTKNPLIWSTTSPIDYIVRWLEMKFLPERLAENSAEVREADLQAPSASLQDDLPDQLANTPE